MTGAIHAGIFMGVVAIRQIQKWCLVEAEAIRRLEALDADPDDGLPANGENCRGENLYRFANKLAREVRLVMGPSPTPSKASRDTAWQLLNKACIARDVRVVDRLKFMTIAVDLVFIPNSDDVLGAKVRQSTQVTKRIKSIEPGWLSNTGLVYRRE